MYKFTSISLLLGLLVLAVFFGMEKCSHDETKKKYNNSMVELEGIKQETETAKSIRALIEEDLKTQADALQDIINDRDEKILAQATVNLRLKDKLFKAENATETVVTKDGEIVVITEENKCDEGLRYKVDFEAVNKPMRVKGFTLTNPAYAEVKLDWVEDFQLEVNLTRDEDGNFRVYTDSDELKIENIVLKVDPEVLSVKWFEKIFLGADLALGSSGAQLGLRPGFNIRDNLGINLMFVTQYDGKSAKTFYGAGVTWYIWKR